MAVHGTSDDRIEQIDWILEEVTDPEERKLLLEERDEQMMFRRLNCTTRAAFLADQIWRSKYATKLER